MSTKLKSNRDHYQGQNEAWKSIIHILQGLLLKCHIILKKNQVNLIFLPQVHIAILAFTLKILAQNFDFWPLLIWCQRLLIWYIDILKSFIYMQGWGLWLGTWWVRRELILTLGKEEVLDSIPVGGVLIPWSKSGGLEVVDNLL